jgi:hypothetical protein
MNQKVTANHIFFAVLGLVVFLVIVFLLVRDFGSRNPIENSTPNVVLPAQSPYSFSTTSPLAIVQTTTHVAKMGSLVNYTGTLPAVGSCQTVSTQAPTYGKNPVHFAFVVNTVATSSCVNPNAPQNFTASFGEDSKGNTPRLSAVFVNGDRAIYTVNGN